MLTGVEMDEQIWEMMPRLHCFILINNSIPDGKEAGRRSDTAVNEWRGSALRGGARYAMELSAEVGRQEQEQGHWPMDTGHWPPANGHWSFSTVDGRLRGSLRRWMSRSDGFWVD
jgi:hypothetical protein